MELYVHIVQLLSFLAVVLFVNGVLSLWAKRRDRLLVAEEAGDRKRGFAFGAFEREIAAFGRLIEPPMTRSFPQKTRRMQTELLQSALADRISVQDVRGLQGLVASGLCLLTLVGVYIFSMSLAVAGLMALIAGFLGWVYPAIWLSRTARRRIDLITKELPYAIDLLTVAMEAGQDFGASLRYVVREGPRGPLAEEFSRMLHQTELGKSRVDAMRAMADRLDLDEVDQLVSAVVQSTETGGSLVATLKIQAEDIRRRRFHRAERKAARAPSIMMIPVALFILPAVFIIIFTPVGIRIRESLQAMQ